MGKRSNRLENRWWVDDVAAPRGKASPVSGQRHGADARNVRLSVLILTGLLAAFLAGALTSIGIA